MDKKQKDLLGIALLATSAVVVAALLVVFSLVGGKAYDEETLCLDEGETQRTTIVVDKSDHFDNTSRVRRTVLRARDELDIHGRLLVFVLETNGEVPQDPVFDLCNPGRGRDVSPIYRNPRQVENEFISKFSVPLEIVLEGLLLPGEAPLSPVTQTVTRAINYDDASEMSGSHKVIVISDFFENSGIGRSYGQAASLNHGVFRDMLSNFAADPSLGRDVEVVLEVIWRSNRDRQKWVLNRYWVRGLSEVGISTEVRDFAR